MTEPHLSAGTPPESEHEPLQESLASIAADEANDAEDDATDDPRHDLFPWFRVVDELPLGPFKWVDFFGNPNPVEVDIGCGRGKFLFESCITRPDTNFLGLELDYKEGRRGARRLAKRQQPNGRVIGGDARIVLTQHIWPGSIARAHVYFPDPWWKRKHRRRRLFTDEFADYLATIVQSGGEVHSWTDVEDYFEVIAALMNHHQSFIPRPPAEERVPEHDLDYLTSFHRRRKQAGCTIWRGCWERK